MEGACGDEGRLSLLCLFMHDRVPSCSLPCLFLFSSNFERFLYHMSGEDGEALLAWMEHFEETGWMEHLAEMGKRAR